MHEVEKELDKTFEFIEESAESVQQLGLVVFNTDNIMSLSNAAPLQPSIVGEFEHVSSGEGKLEGKLYHEIDKFFPALAFTIRNVPFAVKEPLKQEVQCLVKTDILDPVDAPTDCISSVVFVKKSEWNIRLLSTQAL